MAQKAVIKGLVEYREGDGQLIAIPLGDCEVDQGPLDVTISWHDEDSTGATAVPTSDFKLMLKENRIELLS